MTILTNTLAILLTLLTSVCGISTIASISTMTNSLSPKVQVKEPSRILAYTESCRQVVVTIDGDQYPEEVCK